MQEPSLNDLYQLSAMANIAYASRCARRIEPQFQLPETEPDADKMKAVIDMSISWAEEYVQHGLGRTERGKTLTELAWAVAEVSYDHGNFAAYGAHHAVRGALFVAQGTDALTEDLFMEVVAAAFSSSRVLLSNCPSWARTEVVQSLRADYDTLFKLSENLAGQRGKAFDPTSTGPLGSLWKAEKPPW